MQLGNIEYYFAPQEGFAAFRFQRSVKIGTGDSALWKESTDFVWCRDFGAFLWLIQLWNDQEAGKRRYKAIPK